MEGAMASWNSSLAYNYLTSSTRALELRTNARHLIGSIDSRRLQEMRSAPDSM